MRRCAAEERWRLPPVRLRPRRPRRGGGRQRRFAHQGLVVRVQGTAGHAAAGGLR